MIRAARLVLALLLLACLCTVGGGETRFSFRPYLRFDCSLVATPVVEGLAVTISGVDTRRPSTPFSWDWGDGTASDSFFPARHTYQRQGTYLVTVTSHYPDGATDQATLELALPPDWSFTRQPGIERRVFIPASPTPIKVPAGWGQPDALYFSDAELQGVPRAAIEYVLDVAHYIGMDLCNGNVRPNAARKQLVLRNKGNFGCSLWYTDPSSMGLHPSYFQGTIGFSSLFHELGHNLTLNSPANYHFGGKTDGPMNAIVSETLAQIFQHAITYQILNQPGHYGVPAAALPIIRASGIASAGVVRDSCRAYLAATNRYTTYNVPGTEQDETLNTFMAVAYDFMQLAEQQGDYRGPTKRLMRLLHTFCEKDRRRFQEQGNEPFRATLLVAALSYAFDTDLRAGFRQINFPVSDAVYQELMARVRTDAGRGRASGL